MLKETSDANKVIGRTQKCELTLQKCRENELMKIIQRCRCAVHVDEREELAFALIGLLHDGDDVITDLVSFDIVVFQRRIFVEKPTRQFDFQVTVFVVFVVPEDTARPYVTSRLVSSPGDRQSYLALISS